MGRFHDALRQLARRGYFAIEPSKSIVHANPVRTDRHEQAGTRPPASHSIEIAAALPQLRVDAPPAAGLQVDTLFHPDHDDDQVIVCFEPIVIDAGAARRSAEGFPPTPVADAPVEPGVSFDLESPYRPVLDRWAVFSDPRNAPRQYAESEAHNPVEPIVASGPAEVPSSSAGSLADTLDPGEQQVQVEPTGDKAVGPTSFPPTAYEAQIAERLRTPSYGERIRQLSLEISSHPAGGGPCIVLFLSMDTDNQRADAATALALYQCNQRTLPTLLIDADIDARHVSRGFHMNDVGLIEAISGQVPWRDSVRQTSSENLRLLPCGTDIGFISPDSEQEEFQRITQFVDPWREHFGLVLVDGGRIDSPLAPVLTRASDATFVYVQLGKSRRQELAAAVARLEKAGGNILGCITTGPTT